MHGTWPNSGNQPVNCLSTSDIKLTSQGRGILHKYPLASCIRMLIKVKKEQTLLQNQVSTCQASVELMHDDHASRMPCLMNPLCLIQQLIHANVPACL